MKNVQYHFQIVHGKDFITQFTALLRFPIHFLKLRTEAYTYILGLFFTGCLTDSLICPHNNLRNSENVETIILQG